MMELWAITGGMLKAILALVGIAISFLAYLANFFFNLAVAITEWLIKVTMEIPITTGWAYQYGWIFTRDLVNLFFIIILVVIALATILRIKEYQFQKTLPILIIVALLVNFSPVIVGFFVDFFSLLTNLFLKNLSFGQGFFASTTLLNKQMWGLFAGVFNPFESPLIYFSRLAAISTLGAYFGLGTFVFLIIAFLYLARVLAFWILLILAPLAFAAYILPATRRIWTMWWNQLFQWGIVGLVLAFFLYLSSNFLFYAVEETFKIEEFSLLGALPGESLSESTFSLTAQTSGNLPRGIAGLLTVLLPYGISLVFLIIGIMVGLTSGAMGADQIISWSKRGGKWAKAQVGRGIRAYGWGLMGGAMGAIRGVRERKGPAGKIGGFFQEGTKGAFTPAGREEAKRWYRRSLETMRMAKAGEYEAERRKKISEAAKYYESLSQEELERFFQRPAINRQEMLDQAGMIEPLLKYEISEQTKRKIVKIVEDLRLPRDKILEKRLDLAIEFKKPSQTNEEAIAEAISQLEAEAIRKNIQVAALRNPLVVYNILKEETLFKEMEKAKPVIRRQIKETFTTSPYQPPPQDMPLLRQRADYLSRNPHWQF